MSTFPGEGAPDDFDALFSKLVEGLNVPQGPSDVALILTPVADAGMLAGLMRLSDIEAVVIPASHGAIAGITLASDPFASLSQEAPPEALAPAKALSIVTGTDLLLLVARFSQEGEGTLKAWQIAGPEVAGEISPGLALANVDSVVDDIAVGEKSLDDVEGAIKTAELTVAEAQTLLQQGMSGD